MTRTKKSAYKPGAKERADKAAAANPQSYNAPTTTEGGIPQWKLGNPKDFYSRFVSKRQPVVIQGKLEDLDFVTKNWSKVDYLRETAGDAPVKVEPMHKEKKRYGTDVERVDTTFGAFLDSLKEEKDEYDYLTTQYSDDEDDEDDDDEDDEDYDKEKEDQHNEIASGTFPQPIRALLNKEVPMRPEVMGNLVLQQMNIWLGKSKAGTSSGLHHDFHDNLYVLLKGRKRFVLYPPSAVHHLDTYGKVKKIHTNGLIAYKQPGEDEEDDDEEENEADQIRADGLVERDAAALKVQALEEKMDKFEATGKTKGLDKVQKSLQKRKKTPRSSKIRFCVMLPARSARPTGSWTEETPRPQRLVQKTTKTRMPTTTTRTPISSKRLKRPRTANSTTSAMMRMHQTST